MPTQVIVNVYDLYWANEYTSALGVGVFHSGIEVGGFEYAFGGHDFPNVTGVFQVTPRMILAPDMKFREAIIVGETHLSELELRAVVMEFASRYLGTTYSILERNCNHFASEFCMALCGKPIPSWINRLAYLGTWMPQCIIPSFEPPPGTAGSTTQDNRGHTCHGHSHGPAQNKRRGTHAKTQQPKATQSRSDDYSEAFSGQGYTLSSGSAADSSPSSFGEGASRASRGGRAPT
eukprot:Opistho-2@41072